MNDALIPGQNPKHYLYNVRYVDGDKNALGDSGGPVMVNVAEEEESPKWYQIGVIVHGGHFSLRGRGQIWPIFNYTLDKILICSGGFVPVGPHCEWIEEVTHGEVRCLR